MTIGVAWTRARARLSLYRAQLRFCLRMTAAALLAFALAQIWNIPLNGLWSVLTAVVVTQMSVGGSLHATTEYVLGTIGGAIYAATIGVLIPHTTTARAGRRACSHHRASRFCRSRQSELSFRSLHRRDRAPDCRPGRRRPNRIGALPVARGGTWRRSCGGRLAPGFAPARVWTRARRCRAPARSSRAAPSQAAGRIHAGARCRGDDTHAARGRARSCCLPGDCGRGQGRADDQPCGGAGSRSAGADLAAAAPRPRHLREGGHGAAPARIRRASRSVARARGRMHEQIFA